MGTEAAAEGINLQFCSLVINYDLPWNPQEVTLEEQHGIQQQLQKLEKQQRRQRQDTFKAEDEIMEKRDSLVDQLERRLARRTEAETLFTAPWAVK